LLGLLCPNVLGVTLFYMVPSSHPSLVQDAPCPHCSHPYTLGDLLKHVKSVHPYASLISQASQTTLSI